MIVMVNLFTASKWGLHPLNFNAIMVVEIEKKPTQEIRFVRFTCCQSDRETKEAC
jgi:hypothetical protein